MQPLTLEAFWQEQAAWSQATFGPDAEVGPEGAVKHLKKECDEVLSAIADGSFELEPSAFLEEFADLVFLIFDSTRRAGFTREQLTEACWAKLEKNKARKWQKVRPGEPTEHVRD